MNPQATKLLKEANKIKLFEEIKASKDFDLLVDVLSSVLTAINTQKELLNTQKEAIEIKTEALDAKLEEKIKNIELKKGDKGEKGDTGERGEQGLQGIQGGQGIKGDKGADGKDGRDGKDGLNGTDGTNGTDGKDGSPDTGLEIVEKINDLPTDEDKYLIDIEHIDGLLKELKELRHLATTTTYVGGRGNRGHIKPYDLSPFLDGVTKTFNLPTNWSIISVHSGGSTPTTFRPITDYTYTPTSITFTSEISESTTLAVGQTVIIVYEEP